MSTNTLKNVMAIRQAILLTPEEDRAYAARFANTNAQLSDEEFMAKWTQDAADRSEAAKIEQHRQERVIAEFAELRPVIQKQVFAALEGNAAEAAATQPKARATTK